MQDLQRIENELNKRRAKEDLCFLCEHYLGYKGLGKIHQDFASWRERVKKEKKIGLLLAPRGHYKSTVVTIAGTIQEIINDRNVRIMITSAIHKNSTSFLAEIRGHLSQNEELKEAFGKFYDKDRMWKDFAIEVAGSEVRKEATVETGGIDKSLVSKHYDIIIADDLVNRETTNTLEQIEKTKRYFRDLLDLGKEGTVFYFIGTRWTFLDLYEFITTEMKDRVEIMVLGAYDENGLPRFPEKFSVERLEQLRKDKGSFEFSTQYLNKVIDEQTAKFKNQFVKYYKEEDLKFSNLNTFLTVDRAYSIEKVADSTGIIVNSVDHNNNWFLREAVAFKGSEKDLIDFIFNLYSKYNFIESGWEQKAFKYTIKTWLDEQMRKRNKFFSVKELSDAGTNKNKRIEGLIPRWESGTIYLKKDQQDLLYQLLRHPKAEHDDLADALAYQLEIAYPPDSAKKPDAWHEEKDEFAEIDSQPLSY